MTKRKEHLRRMLLNAGPRIAALALAAGMLAGVCGALLRAVNIVSVTDSEGGSRLLMTAVRDPEKLLRLAGLTLERNDTVRYTHGTGSGTLAVTRAFPLVITADGREYVAQVSSGSVADAVAQAGIALAPQDFTTPSLGTPVAEKLGVVAVHRVTYKDTVSTETVPFQTEYLEQIDDPNGRYTHHILRQSGADGAQQVTTRATYIDGVFSGSKVIDTLVTTAPVSEVYVRVVNNIVSPLEAPEGISVVNNVPSQYTTVYNMKATGYSAAAGMGASGLGLYYGTFAVDPTLIPYGTKVYITSADGRFVYGWAIATDTGGFIYNNRMQVDLFYETYAESVENGVKDVLVYVP